MNIFFEKLKNIVTQRRIEGTPEPAIINALKEELQYALLDFLYNNRAYSHLIMYGGTLLRIAYGLPRMSEDLDFQIYKKFDFKKFREDIILHFKTTYDAAIEVKEKSERLTGTDFAVISFPVLLEAIGLKGHGVPTILKIRFDVNTFEALEKFGTEIIPITRDAYAFSIRTYPVSTLMASKIAAVLLRTKRGIGTEISDCKPRDIYDLMWYMDKKIIPDIEYLKAIHARAGKPMEANNILEVFDLLMKRIGTLDDKLFANDLAQFFYDSREYELWHRNWRDRFLNLRNSYEIFQVKKESTGAPELKEIFIGKDFSTENRYFHFYFVAEEPPDRMVKFTCVLSEYWYIFSDFRIQSGQRRKEVENRIVSAAMHAEKLTDLDYEYIGLFYEKIEDYLKRNNYIVLQPEIKTKLLRASADGLNVKTQILLDRRLLLKSRLEDLF